MVAAARAAWRRPRVAWWAEWVGSFDGRVTMRVTPLLARWGWRVDLHRFEGVDDPGCYHTHPAWAMRVILRGGYMEEHEDGRREWWWAGRVGLVRPSLSHRVARVEAPTITLWIRGPKVARIQLRGPGWPRNLRPVMGAEVVPEARPVTR